VARGPRILSELVKRHKEAEHEPLRELIDEYLMKRMDAPRRYGGHPIDMNVRPRPGGRLSPSAIGGCQRQAVLKFAAVPPRRTIDPDRELLFEDGNWRHHKWQFLFYDMECVLGRNRFRVISIEEFVAIPELYIAGSLDALVAIKTPAGKWRRYVVDFKGINDRGFKWVQATDEAKDDNVKQVLTYMKARGVKRGILLYDNKDKNLPQTYTVDFSTPLWDETLEWIEAVVERITDERMPPKDIRCQKGTMMFENCPWRKLCWGHDTTDLQEIAFVESDWQGIDVAWERGMEIYSG
jgi:hypothetical protein